MFCASNQKIKTQSFSIRLKFERNGEWAARKVVLAYLNLRKISLFFFWLTFVQSRIVVYMVTHLKIYLSLSGVLIGRDMDLSFDFWVQFEMSVEGACLFVLFLWYLQFTNLFQYSLSRLVKCFNWILPCGHLL